MAPPNTTQFCTMSEFEPSSILQHNVKEQTNLTQLMDSTERQVHEYGQKWTPPEFRIKEIRDAIPERLFKVSLRTSSFYLFANVVACLNVFLLATCIQYLPIWARYICWPVYWVLQGTFFTGLAVIGHECGHQAFANSKWLNNLVGFIVHSSLLIPYYSWRISHAKHHAYTSHISEDQAFVPKLRSQDRGSKLWEAYKDTPLYPTFRIVAALIGGMQAYFWMNFTGQRYPEYTSHFHYSSPIFKPRHKMQVLQSDIGVFLAALFLAYSAYVHSFYAVFIYYIMPYSILNAWLVIITYLQHSDVYVPHYSSSSWTYTRGALATVDRDYGWFLNMAFHHLVDAHVIHHFFARIPHYHAVEATSYIKPILGNYYLSDTTPLYKSIWRSASRCVFVEDEGDVLFYKLH